MVRQGDFSDKGTACSLMTNTNLCFLLVYTRFLLIFMEPSILVEGVKYIIAVNGVIELNTCNEKR